MMNCAAAEFNLTTSLRQPDPPQLAATASGWDSSRLVRAARRWHERSECALYHERYSE